MNICTIESDGFLSRRHGLTQTLRFCKKLARQRFLSPWSQERLELECEDCGESSQEVSSRYFSSRFGPDERCDLWEKCYAKREAKEPKEEDNE
jgi:hypothetical protein